MIPIVGPCVVPAFWATASFLSGAGTAPAHSCCRLRAAWAGDSIMGVAFDAWSGYHSGCRQGTSALSGCASERGLPMARPHAASMR